MGYVTKKELMEILSMENVFTDKELSLIDRCIIVDKIYNDTRLGLNEINTLEKEGILNRFHKACKRHGFFPKWLENVK